MSRSIAFAISVVVIAAGWVSSAFGADHQSPKAAPIDFRACTFRSGKGMTDVDSVSALYREYANKNDLNYSVWTLTPQFHNDTDFDIGWLGAWPDGEAFGVSMERWNTTGKALQVEIDRVMDCSDRHELAASWPINAPEGVPEDGILMFYACTLHEGKTLEEAYKAHLDAGQAMKALGSLAVSWMFQPAAGAGDIEFDYYHVVGFYRYSDMGATMEMYANGGGRLKQQAILGEVSACNTPTVFDAHSVRAQDER